MFTVLTDGVYVVVAVVGVFMAWTQPVGTAPAQSVATRRALVGGSLALLIMTVAWFVAEMA